MSHFCTFTPLTAQKNQNFEKMKKKKKPPGEIIILHKCTKNYDQMIYSSWDMVCDGCNYFSLWAIFYSFIPLTVQKIKIKKKMKKMPGDIIILHWRYHHHSTSTYVYQKLWSDDVRFLKHGARPIDGRTKKVTYRGGCPTWKSPNIVSLLIKNFYPPMKSFS